MPEPVPEAVQRLHQPHVPVNAGAAQQVELHLVVRHEALKRTEVGEVWGTGPRYTRKLAAFGVTAAETNQYTTIIKNGQFTPRLGLSASAGKSTSIYALYDQSLIPQNGRLANDAEVKPITGNNTEVGVKKDWLGGIWNSTVSAYRITNKH